MASDGDHEGLRKALDTGVCARIHDAQGLTPLMHAARRGHLECVLLLAPKSDLDARACNPASYDYGSRCKIFGATALMVAISHRRLACAAALLAAGADPDAADSEGCTPLMTATLFGNLRACAMLCEAGASLQATDRHGRTAEDIAKQTGGRGTLSLLLAFRERGGIAGSASLDETSEHGARRL